ncbi:MAG TPA: pitrilysin family protein, partial [Bacteroidia bacterium]|nr:pitrilysin family protein [Bacteroidia bacterium]
MRNTYLAILGFLLALNLHAQPAGFSWTEKTSAGRTYRTVTNDPSGTRFYTLPNGLTVILSVNKNEPRIQTLIVTKAGSKTDPSTNTGLAHYLEHMLFKGTDKFGTRDWAKEEPLLNEIDRLYEVYNKTKDPAERTRIYAQIDSVSYVASGYAIANEYDKMCSSMGAKGTNASTSFDRTDYINNIPANMLDKWLELEGERLRKPVLRLFHTELEAVYEEKNNGLDDDDQKVFETIFANLFLKHNYGLQTTIGTIDHLKNPSLNEIRKYFYANYVPNNMAVILAGDFDPDVAIAKIEKTFAFMQPKPVANYTYQAETPISQPVVREVFGQTTSKVNIAFRMPGAATDDAMMLSLVSNMLNNGKAGLIDLNLVKKQQLLESYAFNWNLKDYSVLWLGATPREGQSLETARDL